MQIMQNINKSKNHSNMRLCFFAVLAFGASFLPTSSDLKASYISQNNEIHIAVQSGDLDTVKKLVAADPAVLNQKDQNQYTPLHWAVQRSNVKIVNFLLEKKADPNLRNNAKQTPLHRAITRRQKEIIKALLDAGGDVDVKDNGQNTPAHYAVMYLNNDKDLIRQIIKKSKKVNSKNRSGQTLLMLASQYRRTEIMKLLVELGADVNSRDSQGITPLMHAAQSGDVSVAKLIIENGGDT